MVKTRWYHSGASRQNRREMTTVQIIEAIEWTAPETKQELAEAVGISEQYLSEILRELKSRGVVTKSYVIDPQRLYDNLELVSSIDPEAVGQEAVHSARSADLLKLLSRLDAVTRQQFDAAWAAFDETPPPESAVQLEALSNERHAAIFAELKSYTLSAAWPGNRVASDLAIIATNLEIVGDRACFIADVIDSENVPTVGVIREAVLGIFEAGGQINDLMGRLLFDADLHAYEELQTVEQALHRDLNELFELVTAYDPSMYGYLVTITRALERAIFYWVHAAEVAHRLHSGRQAEHIESPRW
jgi:DNA-binding Lrp family transcriptional regulator